MQISFRFFKKKKKKHYSLKQQYCNMIYMYFDIMHKKYKYAFEKKHHSFIDSIQTY